MKLLILVGCVLAVSAEYQQPYYGPQHIPVIQNGVPVEPPEVQKARANHLAAYGGGGQYAAAPAAYNNQPAPYNQGYNNQGQYNAPQQGRYTPPAYQTSNIVPKVDSNGIPQDTPEVAAAKSNHFAAYSQAHANFGAALSQAQPAGHGYGGGHYRKRRSVYGGYAAYPQHVPVIGPNGTPLDTPEVQHAKAAHFAALADATARAGAGGHAGGYDDGSYDGRYDDGAYDGRYDGAYDGGAYAGGAYADGHARWNGPIHVPVIDHNGVPVEPAAVQHARAAHLAALGDAAARAGAGHVGYGHAAPWGAHY